MDRIKIDIRPLFNMTHVAAPVLMDAYMEATENTPVGYADYVWQREMLQDMMVFFRSGETAMQLIGHFGTGKSSFVEQFHNRLNLPLYVINANPRMEAGDLMGKFYPTEDGQLKFAPGPLVRAAMEGQSILIDEYNLLDPGEATGLNALLEGRAVFLAETGQWVKPQEGFRVFTTVNPKTLGYAGRNAQDVANDDRFTYMWVDYMPEEQEVALLKSLLIQYGVKTEDVATELARQFRQVADAVRKVYMGASDDASALDTTLSTRSLIRWVKLMSMSKGVERKGFCPVHCGLERAKTLKASPESRIAIHEIVHQHFGKEYKTPLTHPELLKASA